MCFYRIHPSSIGSHKYSNQLIFLSKMFLKNLLEKKWNPFYLQTLI
jgi:hypothetical protein